MTYPNSPPEVLAGGAPGFATGGTTRSPFGFFGASFGASFGHLEKPVVDNSEEMLNNVSVYTVADKYGISALKSLARSKFETLAKKDCLPTKFATIVSLVFNSTPSSDQGLRDVVTNKSMAHLDTLLKDPEFSKVMQEEAQLPIDLLCRKHHEGIEYSKQTSSVMTSQEATISALRVEKTGLDATVTHLYKEMGIKNRLLKGVMNCRHCGRGFEGEYKGGKDCLRCQYCKTRT